MPEKNLFPVQALGFGQEHIIRPHFLQDFISYHIGVIPEMIQHHNAHGKDEMQDPIPDIVLFSNGVSAAAGQPVKLHSENQDQHEGKPELRNTARERSHPADQPVTEAPLLPGAENPQKQSQHKGQYKTDAAKKQRISQAALDDFENVRLIFPGNAEIPVGRPLQPLHILDGNRLLEA